MKPFTLHLPHSLAEYFSIARLLAADSALSGAQAHALLEEFDVRSQEKEFARTLLRNKKNLRLYRANQTLACGDFVVIDMSVVDPQRRTACFIELKMGEPLKQVSAQHQQLKNWQFAFDEIASEPGIVGRTALSTHLVGGESEVLDWLCAGSSV